MKPAEKKEMAFYGAATITAGVAVTKTADETFDYFVEMYNKFCIFIDGEQPIRPKQRIG